MDWVHFAVSKYSVRTFIYKETENESNQRTTPGYDFKAGGQRVEFNSISELIFEYCN